ncbi:MAG: hypothetical protein GKS07_09100 [Nitrosopumilus sp.]|nr:MAG: hypothetical protein GKS07_09100 [Nitrosopumilus sp.]
MVTLSEIHDVYSTEISLTLYSDDKFDEKMKSLGKGENILVVKLNDQYMENYPIIKDLIEINLSKDIPKNDDVKIIVSYDELLEIHQYMAAKYAEKYDTSPDDYITINDEKENTETFYHTFEAQIFTMDGKLYGFHRHTYPITDFDKVEMEVGTQEMNYFIRDWEVANLTSDDLKNISKLGRVIDEIGQYDENVQSRKGVTVEEFGKYRQWAKSLKLVNEDNSSQKNAFLEHEGKKYHLFFRDV